MEFVNHQVECLLREVDEFLRDLNDDQDCENIDHATLPAEVASCAAETENSPLPENTGVVRPGVSEAQRNLIRNARRKIEADLERRRNDGYERWVEGKRKKDREEYAADRLDNGWGPVRPYVRHAYSDPVEPETAEDRNKRHQRERARKRRGTDAFSTRRYTDLSAMTDAEKAQYKKIESRERKRRQRAKAKAADTNSPAPSLIDEIIDDDGVSDGLDDFVLSETEKEELRKLDAEERIEAMRSELRDHQRSDACSASASSAPDDR